LPAELRRQCKVIMVSSSLDNGDLKKAKNSGEVLDFLGKPLSLEKLRELIMP
jgi:response regulator of citrate/malate metabolism